MKRDRDRDVASILADDLELLEEAFERGLVKARAAGELTEIELERVRIVRVLVRELEVNWAGAEVIVRMREELLATRETLRRLVDELDRRGG